ncbi:LamG-like jellyroll fold domain-containing protein [Planctomycetota bacterium]
MMKVTKVIILGLLLAVCGATHVWAANSDYCMVAGDHCLSFDGASHVDLGNDASLQLTSGNMTVSAWVQMAPGNADDYMGITSKLSLNRNGFVLSRYANNRFHFGQANGVDLFSTSSTDTYTDTEWHHVAGVMQGSMTYLYVDGLQQLPKTWPAFSDSGKEASIGLFYIDYTGGRNFDGYIDDVRYYNRPLSPAEVAAGMISLPGFDPNLVGYWNLNEGTGQTAYDTSGHANHGQLSIVSGSNGIGPVWVNTSLFCQSPPAAPTISGTIRDQWGAGVQGVIVMAGNGGGTMVTNFSGYYNVSVPYGWTGQVTPSLGGYGFSPSYRSYFNVTTSQVNQDYLGVAAPPGNDTYYVDAVNGHDQNNGHNAASAFRTIQRGLDAAANGHVVVVLDGTYVGHGNKELDFAGKAITLKSQNGPQNTVIDCQGNGRAFYFHTNETVNTVVDGFTMMHGTANQGGAVYCSNSGPMIQHCVMLNNVSGSGGAVYCTTNSTTVIRNCTLVNNVSQTVGGGLGCYNAAITVSNSIFWDNLAVGGGDEMVVYNLATLTVQHSDVAGGHLGVLVAGGTLQWASGNLDVDPLLVDPNNGDCHIKSTRGRYWPAHDVWVLDTENSPAIDSGDPNDAIDDEPQPNGSAINMGAYGGTAQASLSYTSCQLLDDHNKDGVIDYNDLLYLMNHWVNDPENDGLLP